MTDSLNSPVEWRRPQITKFQNHAVSPDGAQKRRDFTKVFNIGPEKVVRNLMSNLTPKCRLPRRGKVHAPFKSPLLAKQDTSPGKDVTSILQQLEDAKKKCAELDEEIKTLMSEGLSVKELDQHIDMLHQYNEIKDATQAVLGRIAVIDGVTVKELHERYNLRLNE